MTQARGFFKTVKGVYETTYGTIPTSGEATMIQLPYNTFDMGSDEEMIDPQTIRGNRYQAEPAFGNISVMGSASVPIDVRNIGYWLRLLLGNPSTSGSGTYTHTFDPANSLPSMTIEQGFSDVSVYNVFSGVKVNSMSMTFEPSQEVTANIEMLGKAESSPASSSRDTSPNTVVFDRYNAKNISMEKGGASISTISKIDLTIRNELADNIYCLDGTGFRNSLPETNFVVEGTMETLFEDASIYNEAISGTETSLEITLASGTNSLVFYIYELKFPRKPLSSSGSEPVFLELPFKAYFQDNAQSVPLRVTLVNDVANYTMGA